MSGQQWRLDLPPWQPVTLNNRMHHMVRARRVRRFRDAACVLAKQQKIPALPRVRIELHYAPRDSRRRDPINFALTLKACEDGIVDAGVIPDDTPEFSEPTMPVIDPPTGKPGRLYLVISPA